MRFFSMILPALFISGPALATQQTSVPEMNVGAGVAAIALLLGAAAIIRERTKR